MSIDTPSAVPVVSLLERHNMALEEVSKRLERIVGAFDKAGVDYALVGGHAVALWVATKEPDAVRTTKNVDILLRREDLPSARAAAHAIDMDYFEVLGVGMFLEKTDPNPRRGVHLIWAGEKVRADYLVSAPLMTEREHPGQGPTVVSLPALVTMKLQSFRDQDRVHLRDMIEVELVDRSMLIGLPSELAGRLEMLLTEAGR